MNGLKYPVKPNLKALVIFCSCLCLSCNKPASVLPDEVAGPEITQPIWHPKGKVVGYNRQLSTTIYPPFGVVNSDGTRQMLLTDSTLYNPSWSPDGRWLAY